MTRSMVVGALCALFLLSGGCTFLFDGQGDSGTPPATECGAPWADAVGSGATAGTAAAVAVGPDCSLYVCGEFSENFFHGDTALSAVLGNGSDVFVVAYGPNGEEEWGRTFTGKDATCKDIAVDDERVVITGDFGETLVTTGTGIFTAGNTRGVYAISLAPETGGLIDAPYLFNTGGVDSAGTVAVAAGIVRMGVRAGASRSLHHLGPVLVAVDAVTGVDPVFADIGGADDPLRETEVTGVVVAGNQVAVSVTREVAADQTNAELHLFDLTPAPLAQLPLWPGLNTERVDALAAADGVLYAVGRRLLQGVDVTGAHGMPVQSIMNASAAAVRIVGDGFSSPEEYYLGSGSATSEAYAVTALAGERFVFSGRHPEPGMNVDRIFMQQFDLAGGSDCQLAHFAAGPAAGGGATVRETLDLVASADGRRWFLLARFSEEWTDDLPDPLSGPATGELGVIAFDPATAPFVCSQ